MAAWWNWPWPSGFAGSPVSYLCAALDTGEVVLERDGIALRSPARIGVIALDEGSNEDEQVPTPCSTGSPF